MRIDATETLPRLRYVNERNHCDDMQGVERLLRMMGADIIVPSTPNPFRVPLMGMEHVYMNGVFVAFRGYAPNETGRAAQAATYAGAQQCSDELARVHRAARAAKLEDFAVVNILDGEPEGARRLREIRAELLAGRLDIPRSVSDDDLEKWALGSTGRPW